MPRVISINAPPGTLRDLVADMAKHKDVLLLPTSTSETNASSMHGSLIECLQNALLRVAHISRCEEAVETLVCIHWYDAPLQVHHRDWEFIGSYLRRHVRAMIMAHGLEGTLEHHAIILDIETPYAFEILIEEMSAGSVSSYHITEYMNHIKTAAGPSALIIPVSGGLFDTPHLRRELVDKILKLTKRNGLPNNTTGQGGI